MLEIDDGEWFRATIHGDLERLLQAFAAKAVRTTISDELARRSPLIAKKAPVVRRKAALRVLRGTWLPVTLGNRRESVAQTGVASEPV